MKRIPPQTFKTGKQTSPRRCRNGAFPGLDTQSREPVRRIRFDTGDSASRMWQSAIRTFPEQASDESITHPELLFSTPFRRPESSEVSSTCVDPYPSMYAIVTPSVAHCISIIQSFIYQVLPDCLLPRYLEKGVLTKRQASCKPLKTWSGRRGSNPRCPAWEYERRL